MPFILFIYLFIFWDGRTKPYFPYLIIVPLIADSRNAAVSWNQMPAIGGGLLYLLIFFLRSEQNFHHTMHL